MGRPVCAPLVNVTMDCRDHKNNMLNSLPPPKMVSLGFLLSQPQKRQHPCVSRKRRKTKFDPSTHNQFLEGSVPRSFNYPQYQMPSRVRIKSLPTQPPRFVGFPTCPKGVPRVSATSSKNNPLPRGMDGPVRGLLRAAIRGHHQTHGLDEVEDLRRASKLSKKAPFSQNGNLGLFSGFPSANGFRSSVCPEDLRTLQLGQLAIRCEKSREWEME